MQTKVQALMNNIKASAPSRDDKWNYIEHSPFSRTTKKALVSDKFNTLHFNRCDETTDPVKHLQHFLALIMIHNAPDVELC